MRVRALLLAAIACMSGSCRAVDRLTSASEDQPSATSAAPVSALGPLSFSSAFRGGIPFGTFAQPTEAFGEVYNGGMRNIYPDALLRHLAAIKAKGGRVVLMFAGNPRVYTDGKGHFSLSQWKARVDRFRSVDFSAYIDDGTIIGHYLLDEPNDPANWKGETVSGATVEEMARYSKQLWPTLTTIVRTVPGHLAKWAGPYRYLDAAWAQYAERKGDPGAFMAQNVADAKRLGLGLVAGLNLSKGTIKKEPLTGTQLTAWASALMADPYICAFLMWQYNEQHLKRADIQAAMQDLSRKAASHPPAECGKGRTPPQPPAASNEPPLAVFSAPACTVNQPCEFTDRSSDRDGTLQTRHWDFGDGESSSEERPVHVYRAANTYTVSLSVTDNAGATASTSLEVPVAPAGNQEPIAGFTIPTCMAGDPCGFTDMSSDSDGYIEHRHWDFGDGSTSAEQDPSHTFAAAGTIRVTLTVTDNAGTSSSVAQDVTIDGPTQPGTSSIVLSRSYLVRDDRQYVVLTWTGASGATVAVYRNGVLRQHTPNDGKYVRAPWSRRTETFAYQICETGTTRCSNVVTADHASRPITLRASVSRRRSRDQVTLVWSGARGERVNILRDRVVSTRTRNDGRYFDNLPRGARSSIFQVCETDTSSCSDPVTVTPR